MIEGRRSTRVLARIPVSLVTGQDPPADGLTAVVNRHGALVLSPTLYKEGTILRIRNELNSEATHCRVTWVAPTDLSGACKLGLEFLDAAPTFWGNVYGQRLTLK